MNYGSRDKTIQKIKKKEEELKVIGMHRYTDEELKWMTDEELGTKLWMLDEWQKRQNQNA